MADVCFQYNDGPIIRESFNFGQFPVMLKVGAFLLFNVDGLETSTWIHTFYELT